MRRRIDLRVRGDNMMCPSPKGTPPRARRRRCADPGHVGPRRNTSAYAEKTCGLASLLSSQREHLRVRGENAVDDSGRLSWRGTPPRARRRRQYSAPSTMRFGNTSAYAEKTCGARALRGSRTEHLRIRGEGPVFPRPGSRMKGTPPRARRRHFPTSENTHHTTQNHSVSAATYQKLFVSSRPQPCALF